MKLELKNLPALLLPKLRVINRFRILIFIIAVAGLYAYVVLQINNAASTQPAAGNPSVSQATAHVDPAVVQKIQQLQDNSVSVQALFNQARSNPFQ